MDRKLVLSAKNIKKTFYDPKKVEILKNIQLEAYAGETIAIMGRSGEGKSTLLQILGTLEPACSGSLNIAGEEVSSFNKTRIRGKSIGFIFQSFHLLEDYTVLENVLMPGYIAREDPKKGGPLRNKAHKLLESVGLADRINYSTKLLSGGEKQRTAIARALCNDPELILADEPTGNLDKKTAEGIQDLLLDFAKNKGKTLILVTHDKELANLCDKQYFLNNGQLDLA